MVKKLLKMLKRRRGFTLMELMIVVAVLGIIAAVLIPQFRGVTAEAKNSRAKSDLRNLKMAVILYQNKYNELPDDSSAAAFEKCLQNYTPRVVDRVPTDPWGTEDYKYKKAGNYFAIWSVGQDGQPDADIDANGEVKGGTANTIVATNAITIGGNLSEDNVL